MALPINIKDLINGGTVEWDRIEFKQGWNPENIIRSICGFANDINNWGGGYIVVGVAEKNGRPILPPYGLSPNEIDKIQKKLIELSYKITPNYIPVSQPELIQGKQILIIWVPGGDNRPYKAPTTLGEKASHVYYVRRGSKTKKASLSEEKLLHELASKIPFDDRINHQANLDDLSLSIIQTFLREVKSKMYGEITKLSFLELCQRMKIVKGSNEYIKPINAGLLLFNENPESFFRGAKIEVVIFKDSIGNNFSEKSFLGPIHHQLKDALGFIKNNILKEEVVKIEGQAEALRFYNYPFGAIEEALANAVYHRSYEHQAPIEVNVRLDRIEILSFPGPLPPIDNNALKKNRIIARDYRNRRIGDFLKELRLTEGRGTGIPKIRNEMMQNGSPKPELITDDENTYFLTFLPIHKYFLEEDLNGYQKIILGYCETARSSAEIFANLSISNQYSNYKRQILPLIEYGYLAYTNPVVIKSRNQKYILTEKGKKKIQSYSNG